MLHIRSGGAGICNESSRLRTGFLGDPEERGSILKLLIGANYPLRTWASTELHSIL